MNEAKFLIDDELPSAPRRGKRGTLFTPQFRRRDVQHFPLWRRITLIGLAALGLYCLYTQGHPSWGMFLLGLACLVLVSLMKRYDWLTVLTRKFFVLLNWVTKVWLLSVQGEGENNDQLKLSEQLEEILSSGWFMGLGVGPILFSLLGLGMGWLSPALALGIGSAAVVGSAGLAALMSELSASEQTQNQDMEDFVVLASALDEDDAVQRSSQDLIEDITDDVAVEAFDDDVAMPFSQRPTEEDLTQASNKDLDAAIEGIDTTVVDSSEVDLAASNKQLLDEIENSRVTTIPANEGMTSLDVEMESLKDSVQAAVSGVS